MRYPACRKAYDGGKRWKDNNRAGRQIRKADQESKLRHLPCRAGGKAEAGGYLHHGKSSIQTAGRQRGFNRNRSGN